MYFLNCAGNKDIFKLNLKYPIIWLICFSRCMKFELNWIWIERKWTELEFSAANLVLARFPLTNALGESMHSRLWNMFNLCLCNAATIRYSQLKFGHMHLCGMDYKYYSPHCRKCNSFGCTAAIRCGNACRGHHSDSLYSGSEHSQFNSPRLVKREAGFPNPRRALIGSNQLWRVNDSTYYRELNWKILNPIWIGIELNWKILNPTWIGIELNWKKWIDLFHNSFSPSG